MSLLQPFTCTCYQLKLPQPPPPVNKSDELDEYAMRKVTLDCRTGAAVTLTRSNIFVHGGLTIPLNLEKVTSAEIQNQFVLYFAKERDSSAAFKDLKQWMSPEIFFLDLISRTWNHVETKVHSAMDGETRKLEDFSSSSAQAYSSSAAANGHEVFRERLFHSMCYVDGYIFVFGGLVMSPHSGYEFTASNELWKLDLRTKVWSLVSKNPQIPRRFNHTMHVKNEHNDTRDTKIVIVGGLNNMDQPVTKIDVYNLTRGYWQSLPDAEYPIDLETNIDGKPVDITTDANFSILVENNEAKIPALAFYKPENCKFASSLGRRSANNSNSISNSSRASTPMSVMTDDNSTDEDNKKDKREKEKLSPIVALPILSGSKGLRMASHPFQPSDILEAPLNLINVTGDYFGYNIVIGGFCPTLMPSDFHCYIYDIPSGKWTRIGITCPDCEIHSHRFWKLCVWKSHHQTLLLGTKNDDGYLPSVQKFDYLLSFGLPIINIFNKGIHTIPANKEVVMPTSSSKLGSATSTELESDFNRLSFSSSQTSQFESYIRYIAPPYEMSSIRSVFPAYAMVLGKDALEIYGKPLSDFEFITSEGESIGVPLFLLRKRWGRFFDMLLSQGYAKVCTEYEVSGNQSTLIKLSPYPSRAGSRDIRASRLSSSASLENYFGKGLGSHPHHFSVSAATVRKPGLSELNPFREGRSLNPFEKSNKSSIDEHNTGTSTANSNDMSSGSNDDPYDDIGPTAHAKGAPKMKGISRTVTSSTTSSSGGMVFRVPFLEKKTSPTTQEIPPDAKLGPEIDGRRRSSLMAPQVAVPKSAKSDNTRRASHPIISSIMDQSQYQPRGYGNSARSSISFVSSSSDRMGKMHVSNSRNDSITENPMVTLNVSLPPQTQTPTEPVPPPPTVRHTSTSSKSRTNSISDYLHSTKGSPFSSRRPSYIVNTTTAEAKTSLDRQLMEERFNEADLAYDKKQGTTKSQPNLKQPENMTTARGSLANDWSRGSFISTTDSCESGPVNSNLEMEPMLIPRSLYMPWSTATVRAFAEFFYTGQVNGKLLLAPVVLDLLVMSKLYEIPLLFNLISEVLYSIVGKKEEGMYVTCKSLVDWFSNKALTILGGDTKKLETFLDDCEPYKILKKIKLCLENIDNGFFDLDLMRRHSVSRSSAHESSGGDSHDRNLSADMSPQSPNFVPTLFAGGPRDSHNSIGSIGYPGHLNLSNSRRSTTTFAHRTTKKSSLSKEIEPSSFYDNETTSTLSGNPDITKQTNPVEDKTISTEKQDIFQAFNSSSSSSSCDLEDEIDQAKLRDLSESDYAMILDARDGKHDIADENREDIDHFDFSLGLLGSGKHKNKGHEEDEAVDPLAKIGGVESPHKPYSKYSMGFGKHPKNENQTNNTAALTLESLASKNALPPSDVVIKSIHQSSVLVNEVRLMIRCNDCLQISKDLRRCRKILTSEISNLEKNQQMNVSESQNSLSSMNFVEAKGEDILKFEETETKTPSASSSYISMDPLVKQKLKSNSIGQDIHPGTHFIEQLHSPDSSRASLSKDGCSKSDSTPQLTKHSRNLHRLGKTSTTGSFGGDRQKKDHTASIGPLSFFSKRK
ncbi:Negative regulator of sporulation MDS3 [Nakaseomyces bracarensis]|uniref:Negative regulator of sporulation MDS3 n=1 Tax=Nakaseomyces bracarensis TaxID=273131 RepID=A0ABR4NMF7_9SACH